MWYIFGMEHPYSVRSPHGDEPAGSTPVSGLCPPSLSAVPDPPRDCRGPPTTAIAGSLRAPIRPYVTSFVSSIIVVSRCSSPSRRARTPRRPLPMLDLRGPAGAAASESADVWASPRAGGRSRSPPRSVSPKVSRRGWSATKPFDWPSSVRVSWKRPSIGLPAPIRPISEKKTARPPDPAGDGPSHVGSGL